MQAILCLPAAYELHIVLHVYKHTYKAVLSVQYSMCYIDYCTIYIYVYILGCIVCMCYILPSGERSEANDRSLFEIPLYLKYIYICPSVRHIAQGRTHIAQVFLCQQEETGKRDCGSEGDLLDNRPASE